MGIVEATVKYIDENENAFVSVLTSIYQRICFSSFILVAILINFISCPYGWVLFYYFLQPGLVFLH